MTGLLGTLVFLSDRLMLARYDQQALASMQLQGPLMWSMTSIFMGVLMGTVALVSRSTGAGDLVRARAVARASLKVSAIIGVGVSTVGLVLLPWVVAALGPDDPTLRELSRQYLAIGLAAMPFRLVGAAAGMVLYGYGDTRTPFVVGLCSNATNIVINWIFIYGVDELGIPAYGVRGAAFGTAASFVVEGLALTGVLWRRNHPLCIRLPLPAEVRTAARDLLRLGMPALLERCLMHAGFMSYAAIVNALGSVVMAANQALVTIESICFLCADGFGVAAATIVGQRLGQGQPGRARRVGLITTAMTAGAITGVGLVVWATSPWSLPFFADEGPDGTAMLDAAFETMPLLALAQPFMASAIVLAMALRGAGDTRSPVYVAIVGGITARVGLAYGLGIALGYGLYGIWIASTVDWLLRTALLLSLFIRGRWMRLRI